MDTNLCSLCPELKLLVLQYLDIDELLNFSLVSKTWYKFISSDVVWHERFRMLEIKSTQTTPIANKTITAQTPRKKSLRKSKAEMIEPETTKSDSANTFYTISRTLTAKQLKEVRACKFRAIHKVKLAFWVNKTNMICNRFLNLKNIVNWPHRYMEYFGDENEELIWNNFDKNFSYNVRFKIYHVRDTCQYKVVHLLHNKLPNQTLDAGVRYHSFLSVGQFMLAQVGGTNKFHVYRFSFQDGEFKHTWCLQPCEDLLMVDGKALLRKTTVTTMGTNYLWHWDLYTGEKLRQIRLSTLVKSGENLLSLHHVKASRLVLEIQYHTKKYVQTKVLLLDLSDQRVVWTTKLNCLQSFMKLEVTCQYIVVLRNKKTEDYELTFVVYNVESGAKLYEVPYHPDYLDYKNWFLPRRGDILVVLCADQDFFYDLTQQREIQCSAYEDSDSQSSDEESVDIDIYDELSRNSSTSYLQGPGDTLIRYRLLNDGHEMCLSLVDFRNNRSFPVARLEGLKMWRCQLMWDKHYRCLVEYYDHHICGTNFYDVW